jgi:hypothetical protein
MPVFRIRGANSGRARPRTYGILAAAFALAAIAGRSTPATAEIYRCVGDDGRVTFTDDASACPGARRHALQPRIQQVVEPSDGPAARSGAPLRHAASPSIEDERAQQKLWQGKKLRAEAELQNLEQLAARLERSVTGCNRGMNVFARDRETGIKARLSCDQIRREYTDAEAKSRELREYLATGLQRECRSAGCLPGWIR